MIKEEYNKIILESQKHKTDVESDAQWNYYKKEARFDLDRHGKREGNEYWHEWAEDNQLSMYDAERIWEDVVEEWEAENEETARQPSVPEWETQEWYDGMVEDYQNDTLEELRHEERAFEQAVRRDEMRGGHANSAESRAILKFIRDMIEKRTGIETDREDPTSRAAMRRATKLRPGETTAY